MTRLLLLLWLIMVRSGCAEPKEDRAMDPVLSGIGEVNALLAGG
ncbi:MAG: hypothetical protein ACKVHO_21105 [Verrucomicrobiia bacterium]|jgi:hypothetical protein